MRRKLFRSVILGAAVVGLLSNLPVLSNPDAISVQQVGEAQIALPDMENWTLDSMPGMEGGESPASFLNLGSLTSLGAEQFTLEQTAAYSGLDVNSLTLDQFPLASEQTLSDLVLGNGESLGVPYLGQYTVGDVPAIANLLQSNPQIGAVNLNQSLEQFVQSNPLAQTLKLNELGDISQIQVGDIPNLANTPLQDFVDWDGSLGQINPDTTLIQNIPGLGNIPLSDFPQPLNLSMSFAARIDTVRGEAEASWERTVTGSDLVGFEFPCVKAEPNTESCSHLELDDIENVGEAVKSQFEGKAWINGQHQWVEGGYGALKQFVFPSSPNAKPGLEPTGRLPFGDFAKLVLWEVDETTDSAQFALFFRYCNFLGCTPYNIGPIPFMSYKRNALIPVGELGGVSGATVSSQGVSNNLPIQTEQKLAQQKVLDQNPFPSSVSKASPGSVITGQEVAGGISPTILAKGAISVLGQGSANTSSDAPVTCVDNNCGKALGEYGLHSTDPAVVNVISQKSGGSDFLKDLIKPGHPTTTELKTFFPPAEQDTVMQTLIADAAQQANGEVDPYTEQLFCGDRLIERTSQILAGGTLAPIDSQVTNADGTLTVESFGQEVQTYYSANGGITQCK